MGETDQLATCCRSPVSGRASHAAGKGAALVGARRRPGTTARPPKQIAANLRQFVGGEPALPCTRLAEMTEIGNFSAVPMGRSRLTIPSDRHRRPRDRRRLLGVVFSPQPEAARAGEGVNVVGARAFARLGLSQIRAAVETQALERLEQRLEDLAPSIEARNGHTSANRSYRTAH